MKKYKFKYVGDFDNVLFELFRCNLSWLLIIGVVMFFGMRDYGTYSIFNMELEK